MLMSCPFCGSEAAVKTTRESFERHVEENGSACLVIGCNNFNKCGTEKYSFLCTDYDTALQEATEKWNRRSYG